VTPDSDRSVGETATSLLGEVVFGVARLLKGELALARAEAHRSVRDATNAIVKLAIAAVFGIVALNLLAGASVAALAANGLSPIWANVAVGTVLLLAAFVIIKQALPLLSPSNLAPNRTLANLRQDAETFKSMVTPHATPDRRT
jgi:hypothetical protein